MFIFVALRKKSIVGSEEQPQQSSHSLSDVMKNVSENSTSRKRRKLDEVSTQVAILKKATSLTSPKPSAVSLSAKQKLDWYKKRAAASGDRRQTLPAPSTKATVPGRKRKSDVISDNQEMICSICGTSKVQVSNFEGRRFGIAVCRPCCKFFENNFLYGVPSSKVFICNTKNFDCSVAFDVPEDSVCRNCKLRKCLQTWDTIDIIEKLRKLQGNPKARAAWIKERIPLLKSFDLPIPDAEGNDEAVGTSISATDLEDGDFVIDLPNEGREDVDLRGRLSRNSNKDIEVTEPRVEQTVTATTLPNISSLTVKPRAAAVAAAAALKGNEVPRKSLSPNKAADVPAKKQRRTVAGVQRERISISSLKSVKPTKNIHSKTTFASKIKRDTKPVANVGKRHDSGDEGNQPKHSDFNERKPRIKHVFRQSDQIPSVPKANAGNAGSKGGMKKFAGRSLSPPPPLKAPIRITSDKARPKTPTSTMSNPELSKQKKKTSLVSPTRSNQQLKPTRCNRCPGCRMPDCGKCPSCLDMPKFGGKSVTHLSCERRECSFQEQLENFTYRRIKLPTISLLSQEPAPVPAIKEHKEQEKPQIKEESIVEKPLSDSDAGDKKDRPALVSTPNSHNSVHENPTPNTATSVSSPNCSTENARASLSLASAASPIPAGIMRSPVQEEVIVTTTVSSKQEQENTQPPKIPDDAELVDVSKLTPILTNFEPMPMPPSETRRRRVCAAILEDCSLDRALHEGIPIITTGSLPAIRALCLLCGSAGFEPMLFCQLCAHPFHTFCLGN